MLNKLDMINISYDVWSEHGIVYELQNGEPVQIASFDNDAIANEWISEVFG